MPQSKITAIEPRGDWDSKYGKMYSLKVTFEDGQSLEVNSKSEQPPYAIGDEMCYEIKVDDPKYGAKGRVFKPDTGQNYTNNSSQGGNSRDEIIMKQTALKCAAEFNAQRQVEASTVLKDAQSFFDWLLNNKLEGE